MKSFVSVAPELPPPPYTWLILIGGAGATTTRSIFVFDERPCASLTVTGSDFAPSGVDASTVARYEKMLSPAVASPREPSSKKGCVALPVIEDKSPVTLRPVLVSFWPGVTATVRSVVLPAVTLDGVALPIPVGLVGCGIDEPETLMSSMPTHS